MIKRINLSSFICRSFYLKKKCHVVASSISTCTSICQNKKERENFSDLRKEFFKEDGKNFADTFGNIESFEAKFQRIKDDPEDILEYEQLKAAPGKTARQYINEIVTLLKRNDYKAALKLFEIDMRNDRIRDNYFIYKVLIAYNGKLGNLKEAYRLFIDYKRRGKIVTGAIYTSMFNACANCINSSLALEKATAVRECMEKNEFHKANLINYNAMMKAYGRHGDISTCLKIMDQLLDKRSRVHCSAYSFLLQACITDKNSGLRNALLVWRKMLQQKIRPNIYSFNLMLKCIGECSLGEVLLIPDAIKQILEESKYFFRRKLKIRKIGFNERGVVVKTPSDGSSLLRPIQNKSKSQEEFKENFNDLGCISVEQQADTSENLTDKNETENHLSNLEKEDDSAEVCLNIEKKPIQSDFMLPNLLALEPTTGSVVEFQNMTDPQHRFMLVGGVNGFLKTMADFGVNPDIKTFTLMLNLMPPITETEEKLISVAESYGISLDTPFYNLLLKRRICRWDHHLTKDCLDQMRTRNIQPDIQTFGILALGCKTRESCIELLESINKHGFRVNSIMVDAFLKRANESGDMKYVLTILKAAKEDEAELDAKCLAKLSAIVRREKRKSLEKNQSVCIEENILPNEEIERAQCPPSLV